MWTRNGLIAIRDLEAPIRGSPELKEFCWADQDAVVPQSPRHELNPTYTDVKCGDASFLSPLDMLYFFGLTPNSLETISQDQLDNALISAIENPAIWNNFKHLFDKRVNRDNIVVEYIRTQLIMAGPFQYKTGEYLENGEAVYARYLDMSD